MWLHKHSVAKMWVWLGLM